MKVRIEPAKTPGRANGKVTLRNACQRLAYRSLAASMSFGSIFSSATYSGSTMNGRKLYVMPATTANAVPVTLTACGIRCASLSGPSTGPSSPRSTFQLIVRIRKLVKNGAMTRNSRKFL